MSAPERRPPGAPRSDRNQRGAVLVWFALFLLVILGFMALGTDVAKLMVTRTMLQNAADAAALAGATAVDPKTGQIVQSQAIARAQSIAQRDKAYVQDPQPVALDPADIAFPHPDEVQVTVRREGEQSMITQFMQVLGIPSIGITATATAKIDTVHTAQCGIVPLGTAPSGGNGTFVPGTTYTLQEAGGKGSGGNYGAVDFPSCDHGACANSPSTGAATWRCLMASGYCCGIDVGQVLTTEPGSMKGPLQQAINDRFASDTDTSEGITYENYTGNGSRVLFVPLVAGLSSGGKASVVVTGFGAFFVSKRTQNTGGALEGEYVYAVMPGDGSGGNGSALSVRLIH